MTSCLQIPLNTTPHVLVAVPQPSSFQQAGMNGGQFSGGVNMRCHSLDWLRDGCDPAPVAGA